MMYIHLVTRNHVVLCGQGVRKLIRSGLRLDHKNAAGKTPLHMSAEAGKLKVTTFLLEKIKEIEDRVIVDTSCCSGSSGPLLSRINYVGEAFILLFNSSSLLVSPWLSLSLTSSINDESVTDSAA